MANLTSAQELGKEGKSKVQSRLKKKKKNQTNDFFFCQFEQKLSQNATLVCKKHNSLVFFSHSVLDLQLFSNSFNCGKTKIGLSFGR